MYISREDHPLALDKVSFVAEAGEKVRVVFYYVWYNTYTCKHVRTSCCISEVHVLYIVYTHVHVPIHVYTLYVMCALVYGWVADRSGGSYWSW